MLHKNALSTNYNAKCINVTVCHIPNVTFPYECIMINTAKQSHCMTCCILRNNLISYYKIMSALYYLNDISLCKQTVSRYLH